MTPHLRVPRHADTSAGSRIEDAPACDTLCSRSRSQRCDCTSAGAVVLYIDGSAGPSCTQRCILCAPAISGTNASADGGSPGLEPEPELRLITTALCFVMRSGITSCVRPLCPEPPSRVYKLPPVRRQTFKHACSKHSANTARSDSPAFAYGCARHTASAWLVSAAASGRL